VLTPPYKIFGAALLGVAITGSVAIAVAPRSWSLILVAAFVGSAVTAWLMRQLEKDGTKVARVQLVANRQHEAERLSLERERDRLQSILGAMSEGVVLLDQNRRIRLANPSARALLSLAAAAASDGDADAAQLGPTQRISTELPPTLLDVNRLPGLQEISDRGLAGERAAVELTLQNGRQVLVRTAPLTEADSQSAVLVFSEVTDLRRLEAVRRDLVANVSHELRTPLTAIRGYAETLQAGGLASERATEFIGIIHRHAERLSRLLDDLLELSRLEAGRRPLKREAFPLRPLVQRSLDLVRPKASHRRVDLSIDVPEGPNLMGDSEALEQVLVNLLDNAVKYTQQTGKVLLRARTEGVGSAARWRIAVSDDGIGIESVHLPRVFERFYRVDSGRSRDMGGTGLGLAIVKHLTHAMSGRVGVESEPGKGSTFWIELPIAS
jgi:two-component system phosphate regulon sensor histidine kinase PhoR